MIALDHLTVRLGGQPVLQDLSLRLEPGRITGLVGESGSGKSMTALAILGLLPAGAQVTGGVVLDGAEITTLPERRMARLRGREIGMVFQEPMTALDPLMTIGAQVAETLRIHRAASRAEARARAAALLIRVGLDPDRVPPERYPHELSGGQRQRVCIAMAIALRPRLLIADEPTTALDVTTQAHVLALLRRLVAEEGMALLLITHDLAVVSQMADTVAVLHRGRLVEQGPTAQVLTRPDHAHTRSLLAATGHRPVRAARSTGAPLLRVEGACKDYVTGRGIFTAPRRVRALNDVSFTLRRGESLGLVGESGCGKSTLARAVLGLEPLDAGRILLADAPVSPSMPAAQRRRAQAVFQDPQGSFDPRQRVARLVAEPFHLTGRPADAAAQVVDALRAVGLMAEDASRYPHQFSGGQRQRIALARALVIHPDLVVLDEAVSALDVSVRGRVLDLLARLQADRGLSYLFISHDMDVVRAITDRVLVMEAGRIVEEGPTAQVYAAPRHPRTRALLDAVPRLTQAGASGV
ncbi:microcin ABC transporter ATP-binding protein [Pacificitalea manganoxidans]|uniref:Microcin ABC transporter ATP-binding protein n=1 Tax=Pacificitalea manganoxidans TaxID=1411902 RepID=A0A291LX44_9RHOB|nr:ABC transporter ATP-binding protein [Pacificitalea manganoxidans]ATI41068.1 microcin ABC transporter ATP-binding protein [Pacificitalea manganoxidans]MDR6308435.1 peptide/nickel transport system ATP-binding protein [Pacificitalea manganoxidans]